MAIALVSNAKDKNKPIFYGHIKFDKEKGSFDTIAIGYLTPFSLDNSKWNVIRKIPDKNGNFSFQLPSYQEPSKMRLSIHRNGKISRGKMCFFENTDSVSISIIEEANGSITFGYSGFGSAKYNMAETLETLRLELRNSTVSLNDASTLEENLSKFNELAVEILMKKNKIIGASGLNKRDQNLVRYEYGDILFEWSSQIRYRYAVQYKNNQTARNILRREYLKYMNELDYEVNSDMKFCPIYLGTLTTREGYNLSFNTKSDSVTLNDFYQILKNKYSGLVREQMLANIFINSYGINSYTLFNQETWAFLLRDSEKYLTIPSLKTRVSSVIKKTRGSQLYDFTAIDTDGRLVSTKSLRGKVILLDMWVTGCSWCAIFHKDFHEKIYPSLKNNKNFIYLSIGAFNKKDMWMEGIKSGKYTSSEYLNVRLNNALQSDFGKYYSIAGLPFMLLIDKNGNIYQGTNFTMNGPMNILNLINQALEIE